MTAIALAGPVAVSPASAPAPPAPDSAPPAFEERGLGRSPRKPGSAGHRALPGPSPSYRWEVPPAQTPARLNRPPLAPRSEPARTARTTRTAEETHP